MNPLLEAALRYADMGYPVFPCAPGWKTPLTLHGYADATTEVGVIADWWSKYPNANIGLPTSGLLVVDVDGGDNTWPDEGVGELGSSAISLTPRGGKHFIFRQPPDTSLRNTAGKLAPKVDTRGDGGYIVVPPSSVNGTAYRWAETFELTPPDQLALPPGWLLSALSNGGPPLSLEQSPDSNEIPAGERNDTLARLAGAMRRVGMGEDAIAAALLSENAKRCKPPLREREVRKIAASIARYEPDQVAVAVTENHYGQDQQEEPTEEPTVSPVSPLSGVHLRVPGFVSEVMDHCLAIAPYPNPVMAFCGALSLQAALVGRKLRDAGDNRTNLYILGLAYSASGKDAPRKLNVEIMHAVGLSDQIGSTIASGEGLEEALYLEPNILLQPDEIDGLLRSVNQAKDARHEGIMTKLLSLYSSANSVVQLRKKVGQSSGSINQPCLNLFGTAIPNHYYESLSERMLTNGFFSRTLVFESTHRGEGQDPKILGIPARVLETAQFWADYRPTKGNLQDHNPMPAIVPADDGARSLLIEVREEADNEYTLAQERTDAIGTTVWGRANEHVRKLALLYAASECRTDPCVSREGVLWAKTVVFHQVCRMLSVSAGYVAANPFHGLCLKAKRFLREKGLSHSALMRKMKVPAKTLQEVVATLAAQGDLQIKDSLTKGRPMKIYSIR